MENEILDEATTTIDGPGSLVPKGPADEPTTTIDDPGSLVPAGPSDEATTTIDDPGSAIAPAHPANCCCEACEATRHVADHPRACICMECVARASGWTSPAAVAAPEGPGGHPLNCVCVACVVAGNDSMHLRP